MASKRNKLQELTPKQFELLAFVLWKSMFPKEGVRRRLPRRPHPVIWSPKDFLGRSPTKSELATLSKRMTTLLGRNYLEKHGREIVVTSQGSSMMRAYTFAHEGEGWPDDIAKVLDVYQSRSNLEAIEKTMNLARNYGYTHLLTSGKGGLTELYREQYARYKAHEEETGLS